MQDRSQVADAARDALAAGDADAARRAYLRLMHDDPGHPTWRLRYADAVEAAGDRSAAVRIRRGLAHGAGDAGRPLDALLGALAHGAIDPVKVVGAQLGQEDTGGPPTLPPPPSTEAGPLAEVDDDAAPPGYPSSADRPRHALPLLSLMDAAAFNDIAEGLRRVSLGPGEVLVAEGDAPDGVYIVVAGELEAVREDDRLGEARVARLKDGAILGEMALVLKKPRSATIRALTDVEAVRIDLAALERVAASHENVADALGAYTRRRLLGLMMASSPLFGGVGIDAREALLRRFEVQQVPEHTILVEQGEPGGTLYVVASGEVEVSLDAGEGEGATTVARLGPGQVFGELALLTREPATASVVAMSDSTVLALAADAFAEICRTWPEIQERLTEIGQDRLAENRFLFADDEFIEAAD
jgi:cAMP-dependent protein kinase regulator